MRWIREHKVLTLFLVILLALIIIFGVSVVRSGKGDSASDVLTSGMSTVSGKLLSGASTVRDNVLGIFSYKQLGAGR